MNQRPTLAPKDETIPPRGVCQPFFKALTRSLAIGLLLLLPPRFALSQAQDLQPQQIPPGASYELGFSPGGTALVVALHAIQSAQHTLLVGCYEFTSKPIAQALFAAVARGVQVQIVADYKASLERYSLIPSLARNGIPVRRDSRHPITHDKYMIVDSQHVELGSFNYTAAAERNAENALVLWNVPDIAAQYIRDWHVLWEESQ